jgi:cell wall-associated NlpC family hydrolase
MPGKATYLAVAGFGGIFVWSALKGKSVSGVFRDLISGKNPVSATTTQQIAGTGAPGTAGFSTAGGTGNAIADVALAYQGHCYKWGGAPGPNGNGCWDCSSFVNWVLGHDLGGPIPGQNGYNGSSHGPTTLSYIAWTQPRTVYKGTPGKAAATAQPGDIVVDAVHMGIAIGHGQMISALNSSLGTRVTGIQGVMIPPTFVKRL